MSTTDNGVGGGADNATEWKRPFGLNVDGHCTCNILMNAPCPYHEPKAYEIFRKTGIDVNTQPTKPKGNTQ